MDLLFAKIRRQLYPTSFSRSGKSSFSDTMIIYDPENTYQDVISDHISVVVDTFDLNDHSSPQRVFKYCLYKHYRCAQTDNIRCISLSNVERHDPRFVESIVGHKCCLVSKVENTNFPVN